MNDLNIAALQTARPTNAGGPRAADSRSAEDPASAFDRVMARVARQDADKAQRRCATADGDEPQTDDDAASAPTADAADGGATAVAVAQIVDLATTVAATAAPATTTTTAGVDAQAAPQVQDAPRDAAPATAARPSFMPVPADPADRPDAPMQAIDVSGRDAARPPRTSPRTAPAIAADATKGVDPAAAPAAAAGATIERAAEPDAQRFEQALAAAHTAARADATPAGNPATPGVAPTAHATYTVAHAKVATPVLHPGFGEDLANRVVFLAGQRVQSAEIALTPADLGPLSVTIEMRGHEAQLFFGAAHATTRAAIEDALPRLREMFAGSGLQLADAQVGDHARRDFARPQRNAGEPMRAIAGINVVPDLRPARPARPDRLIDVVV
ncbi:MAG: flagellar hook-length control protein FliK [Pseudomonadota bacterium]